MLLLSAGQAGATAPAPLATAIVQAVAECLAGVVYVNAMSPGFPAIFGTWPFVSDLRTRRDVRRVGRTGAADGRLRADAPLLRPAGRSGRGHCRRQAAGHAGGLGAGRSPTSWPGLSGLNMVYEAAGMHASLLGFCLESLVLGDDMLGQVLRCVRGIDVTEDSVSIETMRQVCLEGPGHYLGHAQTLALMQTRVRLSGGRRPAEPEGMGRGRQAGPDRAGHRAQEQDPCRFQCPAD